MNTKYVTSLELSKQLYAKNIITDAEHWWLGQTLLPYYDLVQTEVDRDKVTPYPAPTAEELLELMPLHITIRKNPYIIDVFKMFTEENCQVEYRVVSVDDGQSENAGEWYEYFTAPKLSDACAKMLLWLHEKGYLK